MTRRPSPRKARQAVREKSREIYRSAILDAAEAVFSRGSFGRARMSEIAREAGMATGTLYNYFENKDEIFRSLVERAGRDVVSRLRAVRDADPVERLRGIVRRAFEYVEEHSAAFAVFVELGGISENNLRGIAGPRADAIYQESLAVYESAIRDALDAGKLREGLDPRDLVAFLTGATNGVLRLWLAGGRRPGLVHQADTVLDLFLHGAGAPR